uniref:Uncharacterized protein n=1 Tax=Acrobeloides nanus TaxID=290746 RepID=A0A914DP54_9BILA
MTQNSNAKAKAKANAKAKAKDKAKTKAKFKAKAKTNAKANAKAKAKDKSKAKAKAKAKSMALALVLALALALALEFWVMLNDDGEVWVLSKNETNCDCCQKSIQNVSTTPNRLRQTDKPSIARPETLPLNQRGQAQAVVYKPYRPMPQDSAPTTLSIDKMRSTIGVTRIEVPGMDEVDFRGIPQKPGREYQKTARSLNTITTQPVKMTTQVPVKPKEKPKKKHKNCCEAFCVECGNFCVQLIRST